jgi:patatin-like phospholipase/acyl hydrolase
MKTILSIDGGGMRGYIPCSVLVALEAKAGKPCGEIFDMFAGTSIGGILACLLASGKTAGDALKFFTEDGPRIFGQVRMFGHNGFCRPRYAAEPLEDCLIRRLGNTRLSGLKKSLVVPAFDLEAYQPYFFKTPHMDKDYALWQVARATSAAQTYFPAYQLDRKILWDGGNAANNPAICAVAEAYRIWPGEKLRILSLGCGAARSRLEPTFLVNAGLLRVGLETMGLLFDANDELPDYILKQFMPKGYFRVSPMLTKSMAIDGASGRAMSDLFEAANGCVQDAKKALAAFLAFH